MLWIGCIGLLALVLAACGSSGATRGTANAATSTAKTSATPAPGTRDITVSAGATVARLNVELAATEPERERGLMQRAALADSAGMLFLFPADTTIGFWMKDTLIALDIAYLDADGKVLGIVHGKPLDETELPPPGPYRYTLEVAGGWFGRKGLGLGAVVAIPKDLPKAQ
jgi:uncharacterized membrane protein (UPF0127 family)